MQLSTSVIITAYNLEKFIADAIQSVLNQTLAADEVIVVDDCSSDSTAEIIKGFGKQVRYLKMPKNSGGLSATFYGVQHAKGDILLFLDGDDLWMPEKIASVLPLFEQHPQMAVVSHDYVRVDSNRNRFDFVDDTQENILRILKKYSSVEERSEAFKDSILGKRGYWGGSAYSLRRTFVDMDKFENWRKNFEFIRNTYLDLVLPTFILVNHPDVMVGYVHKKLFEYRIHDNNTSGNKIPDIAAAKKALRMGQCTTIATHGLLGDNPNFKEYSHRQSLIITEYEFLTDIYDNKKGSSLKKFIFLASNHWKRNQITKEFKRLIVSSLLGPKIFLYLKNKFS